MNEFDKLRKKYEQRKKLAICMIVASVVAAVLVVVFIFVGVGENQSPPPLWTQYQDWAVGLFAILLTGGVLLLYFSHHALRDIEKTFDRLNPDEREKAIRERTKAKSFGLYVLVVFPVFFVVASILLMLNIINFVAWIIFIANFLAVLIIWGIVRKIEEGKY